MTRLPRSFFARNTARVAKEMLGAILVSRHDDELLRGRVVEVEAYYGEDDPPSHASSGKTGRSRIMWEEPGISYVYLIYGIHLMFNAVTELAGKPGAVLVRAVEPLEGLRVMRENRNRSSPVELASGPGKLTEAFGIGREANGEDLINSEKLWFEEGKVYGDNHIESSGRIGVSRDVKEPLRFYLPDNRFVSG